MGYDKDALPQNYTDKAPEDMKKVENNLEVVQVNLFQSLLFFPSSCLF